MFNSYWRASSTFSIFFDLLAFLYFEVFNFILDLTPRGYLYSASQTVKMTTYAEADAMISSTENDSNSSSSVNNVLLAMLNLQVQIQ